MNILQSYHFLLIGLIGQTQGKMHIYFMYLFDIRLSCYNEIIFYLFIYLFYLYKSYVDLL